MSRYPLLTLSVILWGLLSIAAPGIVCAQDTDVKKVYAVFKTHLDIGFTDLSSNVERKYIEEFIPKAISVAEELKAEGGEARYVWTTGAWLIDAYLKKAEEKDRERLVRAIRDGDIVWNAMPYTVESESLNREMFSGLLKLSRRLDAEFGRNTAAAKMTDVPGHTRSIVPIMAQNGIKLLHIGVNPASTVPDVPPVCRWRSPDGSEIILMYQKTYGEDMVLPDGKTVLSINFTNDNNGPHTVQGVKDIYASLHKRYPDAAIVATSLDAIIPELEQMKETLPVLTSEIGDTWIYGYGSSPVRMAQYRALSRLYSQWINDGRLNPGSEVAIDYAVHLGMIAEHTWGPDVKTFLRNWDKYDYDSFTAALSEPSFRFMEQSWKEKTDRITEAVGLLPEDLRIEAEKAIGEIQDSGYVSESLSRRKSIRNIDSKGRYALDVNGIKCLLGGVTYQAYSDGDYQEFLNAYLSHQPQWALEDFGKPGLENSGAKSLTMEGSAYEISWQKQKGWKDILCRIGFDDRSEIDGRVLPSAVETEYRVSADGRKVEMTVRLSGKPANRMPEAYWVSFRPEDLTGVIAEKTGSRVDLLDVVTGGNRQMHGIDRYVDLITSEGTVRITSYDALLLSVGERNALNFSRESPDLSQGVHFCLYNNLWGTNFSMWWSGSISYRFTIELL